jgi:hypothetical protein
MIVADSPAASFTGAGCTLGTVVATPGAPQVLLTGAAIAAGSVCELKVNVTSILDGNLTNDIPVGALQTQQSVTNNNSPAATLTVLRNTNIGKSFLPSTIAAGGTALLKISVYNSNDVVRNGVDPNTFTDNFPPGLTLASATSSNSCGGTVTDATGGALNAADTGIRLNGGVFGINSVCTITVVVTAASTGTYVNTIPAGSMSTAEGSTNVDPAQATLTVVTTPLIAKGLLTGLSGRDWDHQPGVHTLQPQHDRPAFLRTHGCPVQRHPAGRAGCASFGRGRRNLCRGQFQCRVGRADRTGAERLDHPWWRARHMHRDRHA